MWQMTNFHKELEMLIYGCKQTERIFAPQGHHHQSDDHQNYGMRAWSGGQQNNSQQWQYDQVRHTFADSFMMVGSMVQPATHSVWWKRRKAHLVQAMNGGMKWKSLCIFCNGLHFNDWLLTMSEGAEIMLQVSALMWSYGMVLYHSKGLLPLHRITQLSIVWQISRAATHTVGTRREL